LNTPQQYQVELKPKAVKDLKSLPQSDQEKVSCPFADVKENYPVGLMDYDASAKLVSSLGKGFELVCNNNS
jgi:mRNA-degrading endonuclease RelE of RelBE toxin-antitoxin system